MRALIEAPLEAGVIVRGGDQVVTVPLLAILERPQHTPAAVALDRQRRAVVVGFAGRRSGRNRG